MWCKGITKYQETDENPKLPFICSFRRGQHIKVISTSEQSSPKSAPVLIKMSMKYKSAQGTFQIPFPFNFGKAACVFLQTRLLGPPAWSPQLVTLPLCPGSPSPRPTLRGSWRERGGRGHREVSLFLQLRLKMSSDAAQPSTVHSRVERLGEQVEKIPAQTG